jgi:prepilin-type N-terminal cleavage/methylation domain-containing protein
MCDINTHRKNKGFTLVELSIVIVVIGLIVGAVTAGVSLVQAAKLHSDIAKFREYKMAYSLFMDQYNAVPGDMRNATAYWPGVTADGNGNKIFDGNESQYTYNQLSLAKLIKGTFIGWDYPKPSIGKNSGSLLLILTQGTMWLANPGASPNVLVTYDARGGAESWNNGVSPKQALAIDIKIDDGVPNKGKVAGFSEPMNDCIKQSDGTTNAYYGSYIGITTYNLAQQGQICAINMGLSR